MHYLAELALLEVQMLQYTSWAQWDREFLPDLPGWDAKTARDIADTVIAVIDLSDLTSLRPSHIAAAAALLSGLPIDLTESQDAGGKFIAVIASGFVRDMGANDTWKICARQQALEIPYVAAAWGPGSEGRTNEEFKIEHEHESLGPRCMAQFSKHSEGEIKADGWFSGHVGKMKKLCGVMLSSSVCKCLQSCQHMQ